MIYESIGPFCSLMGTRSQVRIIDDEDNALPVKLRGIPLGPVKREKESEIYREVDMRKAMLLYLVSVKQ